MTTNTSNSTAKTFTSDECASVVSAYKTLHEILTSRGVALPEFGKCSETEYDNMHKGALKALITAKRAAKEQARAQFRQSVNAALDTHISGARKAREAFDALSDEVKAYLPKPLTGVNVPVSSLSDIFPQGATESQVVLLLKDMDYTLVKGGAKKDIMCVQVSLVAKTESK